MSDKPLTAYGVGLALLSVMDVELGRLKKAQAGPKPKRMVTDIANLGRAISAHIAELRKSVKDAKDMADVLTEEKQVELVLGLVEGFSPEYRDVIAARIEELGGKLIT